MFNLRLKVFTGTETGGWNIWESYASEYTEDESIIIYTENESVVSCNNENLLIVINVVLVYSIQFMNREIYFDTVNSPKLIQN